MKFFVSLLLYRISQNQWGTRPASILKMGPTGLAWNHRAKSRRVESRLD